MNDRIGRSQRLNIIREMKALHPSSVGRNAGKEEPGGGLAAAAPATVAARPWGTCE